MKIYLIKENSYEDFERRLRCLAAETALPDMVASRSGPNEVSLQKATQFGRVWQRVEQTLGSPAYSESEVQKAMTVYLRMNGEWAKRELHKPDSLLGLGKIRIIPKDCITKFLKNDIENADYVLVAATRRYAIDLAYFQDVPYFYTDNRSKTQKQDPKFIDFTECPDSVVECYVEWRYGNVHRELSLEDAVTLYHLAHYVGDKTVQKDLINTLVSSLDGKNGKLILPKILETVLLAYKEGLLLSSDKFFEHLKTASRSVQANWLSLLRLSFFRAKPDAMDQCLLGLCYFNGIGISKNVNEAVKLWRTAAEQGCALAQYHLGLYYKGLGLPLDREEAAQWFSKAAEQGHREAQFELAICCLEGAHPSRVEIGVRWLHRAAEQGYAKAQFELGVCYFRGMWTRQDDDEAIKWFYRAAEQGYVHAQFELAMCYFKGDGLPKNYVEAVKWWRMAAEQGDAVAQFNLGWVYYQGKGVPRDYIEAVKWWRVAAEQGDAVAQCNLGFVYYQGKGVPRDYIEAVKWWRVADEQGNSRARYYLGLAYYNGDGVPRDRNEASNWWHKAINSVAVLAQAELGYLR